MWAMLLEVTPSPITPGFSIPWWTPFACVAAAVVLAPAIITDRLSAPKRIAARRWFGSVPIAGLALLSWVAFDTCLPPVGPPCYRADRMLFVLGIAWAILAIAFLILLVRTVRTAQSSRPRRDIAPIIVLLAVLSISVGMGTLPFLGYVRYEPVAGVIGWSAFTTGFVAFALATIGTDRLLGRWAQLARWLTLAEGVVLMTFAFVSVYIALGPPPVFA